MVRFHPKFGRERRWFCRNHECYDEFINIVTDSVGPLNAPGSQFCYIATKLYIVDCRIVAA